MTYILFGLIQILGGVSTFLNKKFQIGIKNNMPTMMLYNMINACFGSVYFFFICKMHVEMNLITFVYSLLYALIVINSLAIGVIAISKLSISFNSVISTASGVIGAVFFGIMLFGEKAAVGQIVSAVILIGAVAVTAFAGLEFKGQRGAVLVCVWLFLTGFLTSPFIKLYTQTKSALEINNMFFMTNVLVVVITAAYSGIYILKNGKIGAAEMTAGILNKTAIANIASRTAISNISSVVSAYIIANMDLTVYTIFSSGLGLMMSGFISKFVFRERLTVGNYVSILLAIAAIVIRVI